MKKPVDLRDHLTRWVPTLARNPDKLHVFIEKGAVATKPGAGLGFQYAYTLQLVAVDFADSPDTLVVPLLVWLYTHQPDLLQDPVRRERALAFAAEIVDDDKFDIEITLELTERVLVKDIPAGYECQHLGEPPLIDDSGPTDWEIYLKGERIAAGSG